jgi:impB/mucB/samB family
LDLSPTDASASWDRRSASGFYPVSIFFSVWPSTRRRGQSCCRFFCARLAPADGARVGRRRLHLHEKAVQPPRFRIAIESSRPVPCLDRRFHRSATSGQLKVGPFDLHRHGPTARIRLLAPGPDIVGHGNHSRFDQTYREVSNQIHAIFKGYTRFVEPLSLDEAYLDVTDNLKGIRTAWETAKQIGARIHEEIRLTASAGISRNKFLAKLASDCRKPNGQFAILPGEAEAFVAILPVAKFHGVGPKTAVRMRALGIETGADLARQTLRFCRTTSARREVGTTTSREVGTTGWSNLTANESRRDRRRLFQKT